MRAYFDTELLVAESKGKMAHDFRVFFMRHKGSMESKYTTNKGVLPEILLREMRDAYVRSEEFLDLETAASSNTNSVLEQKQQIQDIVHEATPEQLDLMLEALHRMMVNAGNIKDLATIVN